MRNTHVPVGPWRGVNTNQNGVYMECFMDEVAKAAGKDPLEFRRALMKDFPKHSPCRCRGRERRLGQAVTGRRASRYRESIGYGVTRLPPPRSRSAGREVEVHRMVLALDCGDAVNPSQIEGPGAGIGRFGLAAMLYGEMPVENGGSESRLRQLRDDASAEMPKVETVILPTYHFWGGVGERTICVVARADTTPFLRQPANRCASAAKNVKRVQRAWSFRDAGEVRPRGRPVVSD